MMKIESNFEDTLKKVLNLEKGTALKYALKAGINKATVAAHNKEHERMEKRQSYKKREYMTKTRRKLLRSAHRVYLDSGKIYADYTQHSLIHRVVGKKAPRSQKGLKVNRMGCLYRVSGTEQ